MAVTESFKTRVAFDLDRVYIIHRSAAHALVVPGESHWLDQVDRYPEARAEAEHGADILGDLWLEEGDTHRRCDSPRGP